MKHMNAVTLKPHKRERILNDPNYICEEKLKGIRAFLTFTEEGCVLMSRGGHDVSCRFPHLSSIKVPELKGVTLDGELFQRGVEDEVISGWGNHNTKHINPSVTKDVKFIAFDVFDTSLNLRGRKGYLEGWFALGEIPSNIPILYHPHYSNLYAEKLFKETLEEGGEGIMLKNLNSLYHPAKAPGQRPPVNTWYKWKGEETFDVVITGFEMAEEMSIKKGDTEATPTKFAGKIGAFKYGMYVPDSDAMDTYTLKTLGTCSGMTDLIRDSMTYNWGNWIGQVVEIKGVEQKESGAIDNPRYIRLREDKKPEECVWK